LSLGLSVDECAAARGVAVSKIQADIARAAEEGLELDAPPF
jgi:hypothetical protein